MHWFSLIFLIFAVASLGGAAKLAQQVTTFLATAKKARGVVVRLEKPQGNDTGDSPSDLYSPVVRFADDTGTYHEFSSSVGTSATRPRWPVNSAVDVIFDPKSPESASINMPMVIWMKPIILGVIGGMMLLGALVNFF